MPLLIPVLVVATEFGLNIALSWWVVHRDMRHLSPCELARAWSSASLGAALAFFAPLCILVHFIRVRRSWRGLALGILWMVGVVTLVNAAGAGLEALLLWMSRA